MVTFKIKSLVYLLISLFCLLYGSIISAEEMQSIKLAEPDLNRGKLLMQALKERKSMRSFNSREIPLDVLSNLLWAASGINRPKSGMRTAPTAVNWQEIDIYVAMQKGLYLYNPSKHILEPIMVEDIRDSVGKQPFTKEAPVSFIYVANFAKMSPDPEQRAFYSATDTGFISQNVYLFCASEGLATVILGLVDKSNLKKIMKLRDEQHVILTQPVGYSK